MTEWLHDMYWLNQSIEADYYYELRYDEPPPYDHKARCKALEALATLYRKNFL